MAFIEDALRVAETSTSTGTGAFALAGALAGFIRFNAIPSIATSDTMPYTIIADDNTWECGIGTYSSANTLTRTTVLQSSNSNSVVTFAAGDKKVFLGYVGLGRTINKAVSKTTPADNDELGIADSAASNKLKKLTWANLRAAIYALANNALTGIKTATFNSQGTLSTTTGAVTVDWTAAQNYKQNEPTGTITYTFTAPPGVCHLQLLIDSDGTSTAQTINFPGTVIWYGQTFAMTANKKHIINMWWDGTNYHSTFIVQV